MPFLADHLWRYLVDPDQSVHLAPWPEADAVDDELLAEVADVRRVVELGRRARDEAEAAPAAPLVTRYRSLDRIPPRSRTSCA